MRQITIAKCTQCQFETKDWGNSTLGDTNNTPLCPKCFLPMKKEIMFEMSCGAKDIKC